MPWLAVAMNLGFAGGGAPVAVTPVVSRSVSLDSNPSDTLRIDSNPSDVLAVDS